MDRFGERPFDIALSGAGPAAALAAYLLAQEGRRVALVGVPTDRPRLEGLSDRAGHILAHHGFAPPAGAVSPRLPRIAHWGGAAQDANRERLVDRKPFDRALIAFAERAGAQWISEPIARLAPGQPGRPGRIVLDTGAEIVADRVIEARGARAPRPEDSLRGPPLLGVGRAYVREAGEPGIRVVPLPEGWLWTASVDGRATWVQAAVDPSSVRGAGSDALSALLGRLLAEEPARTALGDLGAPAGPPLARDAGPCLSARTLDPELPRIGDAAARFDPLSGHGLFFAISSALSLPPVLRALEHGGPASDRAARFYRERVADAFLRQARVGRDFYLMDRRYADEPFWHTRSGWPDGEPSHPPIPEPFVRPGVAVEQGELVDIDLLITPEDPMGIAWVAGVPVVAALREFARLGGVADRHRFGQCCVSGTTPEAAAACFDWLTARDLLKPHALKKRAGGDNP